MNRAEQAVEMYLEGSIDLLDLLIQMGYEDTTEDKKS